jgi:hypothetical protein
MVNAQKWLDNMYPKEGRCVREDESWFNNSGKTRSQITKLDISKENLEGDLKLGGFVNLEELLCCGNKLTSLKIIDSSKLKCLDCSDNEITELEIRYFPNLKRLKCQENFLTNLDLSQNEKLKWLNICNNNFFKQDLSLFSHLVNLEILELGNWGEDWNPDTYNRFVGSLEPLKNLTKLGVLLINNTDIDSGLEHLSKSLRVFNCQAEERPNARVKKLETELKRFGEVKEKDYSNFLLLLTEWRIQKAKQTFQNLFIVTLVLLVIVSAILLSKLELWGSSKKRKINYYKPKIFPSKKIC